MNSGIEDIGRRAPNLASDQVQSRFRINRRLVFGEHDQCRPAPVESWVHARRNLNSACQRQPNMRAVPHFVRSERAFDFVYNLFVWRNFGERKGAG